MVNMTRNRTCHSNFLDYTLPHLIPRELISAIIAPLITPNMSGTNRRDFQAFYSLILLGKSTPRNSQRIVGRNKLHLGYTRKFLGGEFIV